MTKQFKITLILLILAGLIVILFISIYARGSDLSIEIRLIKAGEFYTSLEKKVCDFKGWEWKISHCGLVECSFGCFEVYKDGGKACSNSSDCQGRCILSKESFEPVCEKSKPTNCITIDEYNNGVVKKVTGLCIMG